MRCLLQIVLTPPPVVTESVGSRQRRLGTAAQRLVGSTEPTQQKLVIVAEEPVEILRIGWIAPTGGSGPMRSR